MDRCTDLSVAGKTGVDQGAIWWEGAIWLRRRVGEKEVNPGLIQFISVVVVDVVWVLDFF
jgi:hypothetical protein